MYNDPSGEFIFTALAVWLGSKVLAAAVVGAVMGVLSYTVGLAVTGNLHQWSLGGALKSAFWGGVGGAVTFGIGSIFSSTSGSLTAVGQAIEKVVGKVGLSVIQGGTHAVAQGVLSVMQGGSFEQAFWSGALGSLGASAFGAMAGDFASSAGGTIAFGAISGGIGAELSGGNFWEGALIGGIVAGLNHVMHKMTEDDPPKFFKKMKDHYESKTGKQVDLTLEEFKFLLSKGKVNHSTAKLIDAKNNIYSVQIDFYDSGFDLSNTFGKASVTYREVNGKKLYRSFYDKYDFDPKPWGVRSRWNEIKTRAYNIYSSGKAFEIKFDQNYLRK